MPDTKGIQRCDEEACVSLDYTVEKTKHIHTIRTQSLM